MPPRSHRQNILVSVFFTLFGGPGVILVLLPAAITRWRIPPSSTPVRALAWTLIIAGLLPLFESIARFVWAGQGTLAPFASTVSLVISGFYRYVRNPMYVADLTVISGQAVLFHNVGLVVYGLLVWLGLHIFVTQYEEPTLRRAFGSAYATFCNNVPRWVPRFIPWRG
jgi:protein-S-isoprenylcysteine O-methyltransferase Ste14